MLDITMRKKTQTTQKNTNTLTSTTPRRPHLLDGPIWKTYPYCACHSEDGHRATKMKQYVNSPLKYIQSKCFRNCWNNVRKCSCWYYDAVNKTEACINRPLKRASKYEIFVYLTGVLWEFRCICILFHPISWGNAPWDRNEFHFRDNPLERTGVMNDSCLRNVPTLAL
jgi:hypothetical protein